MKKMGFIKPNGTTAKKKVLKLDTSDGDGMQVDAIGMFGNRVFIVQAKLTNDKDGLYAGLTNAIDKHTKDIAKLRKEINAVRDGNARSTENETVLKPYAQIDESEIEYLPDRNP